MIITHLLKNTSLIGKYGRSKKFGKSHTKFLAKLILFESGPVMYKETPIINADLDDVSMRADRAYDTWRLLIIRILSAFLDEAVRCGKRERRICGIIVRSGNRDRETKDEQLLERNWSGSSVSLIKGRQQKKTQRRVTIGTMVSRNDK